ncbi:hypothetical protein B0H11DRAFT_1921375 [Mycena galericulata]|nr:hypothetical protein B0H11DRAFT_1921375 [Mycena galericulata]
MASTVDEVSLGSESDDSRTHKSSAPPSTLSPSHDRSMAGQTPPSFAHLPSGSSLVQMGSKEIEGSEASPSAGKKKVGRPRKSLSTGNLAEGGSVKVPKQGTTAWVNMRLDQKSTKHENLMKAMENRISDTESSAVSAQHEITTLRDRIAKLEAEMEALVRALRDARNGAYSTGSESGRESQAEGDDADERDKGKRKALSPDNPPDAKRARRSRSRSRYSQRSEDEGEWSGEDDVSHLRNPSRKSLKERLSSPDQHHAHTGMPPPPPPRSRSTTPPRRGRSSGRRPPTPSPPPPPERPRDDHLGDHPRQRSDADTASRGGYHGRGNEYDAAHASGSNMPPPTGPRGGSQGRAKRVFPSFRGGGHRGQNYGAGNRGGQGRGNEGPWNERGNAPRGRGGYYSASSSSNPYNNNYASSSSAPYRSPSPPMPPPHDESPPAPPTYPSKRPAVRIGEVAWVANKTRDGLMSFVNMIRDEKMGPIPTPKTVSEPEGKKGRYVVATFHTRHDAGNFVKAWERWRVNSGWNKVSAVLDE